MAEIKFKTEDLIKVVAQLDKLVPSKLLEITRYWHIESVEDEVYFTAYDGSNFIRVAVPGKGEIDVMVKSEQFGKLINKTTSEFVKLVPGNESLKLIGNGEYQIEIVQEDESYPSFDEYLTEDLTEENALLINTKLFYSVANINDSAVSKSGADGIFTGYLIDNDKAITTDIIRVCINPIESFEKKILIPASLMNVLASLSDEKMYMWLLEDDSVYISTSTVEVYGKLMEGIEDYIDVTQLDEQEFEGSVALPTLAIHDILERLTLFMNTFDKGTVIFKFSKSSLTIQTTTNSYEKVKYAAGTNKPNPVEFECRLNSLLLRDIISTVSEDHFEIEYGNDAAIRIKSNGVVYFLALQEEEE